MRKRIALLLSGTMTLSILLSACGSQVDSASPAPANSPSPYAAAEPAASQEPEETASNR